MNFSNPVRQKISPKTWALACQLAEYRTFLQEQGQDVSLSVTTYPKQRLANNIMGQAVELAFATWLRHNHISFMAPCFAITYRQGCGPVQPPSVDFVLPHNLKCDLKADRYDITQLGAILPVEKLTEKWSTDLVVWAELRETDAEHTVCLHGWNYHQDLQGLHQEPDATRPDGSPLPKRAKRVPLGLWRDMNELLGRLHQGLEQCA